MLKRILISRLFLLFVSLLIIGFFIGYDYSVLTSRVHKPAYTNSLSTGSTTGTVEGPPASDGNAESLEDVNGKESAAH